jgi:hypothetical protein
VRKVLIADLRLVRGCEGAGPRSVVMEAIKPGGAVLCASED